MMTPRLARPAAALVAAVAWAGLGAQLNETLHMTGSVGAALWVLLRFFTIITNLSLAVVFSLVAARTADDRAARFVPALTLAILLVGVVYALLLDGLERLTGTAILANVLLHRVTPILVPLWWLAFAPKGKLGWGAPWRWAAFPLVYLPYALARGRGEGKFAYPFLNIDLLGWAKVAITCAVIAAGFIIAGHLFVLLDRAFARRS
ncbi:Pr6Pr family membrane protein [Sphingobium aquiterrae]|uniref:Pr6Pr family membrane protein n=1 Tax=Sphingobium aquiterrae TaxID=2038656 RepID=UPI003016AE99